MEQTMNIKPEPSSEPPTGEIALPTTRGHDGMVTVHAPGLDIITTMARNGHPVTSIAAALGMSARVMRECRKRQPEVEEAFAVGLGGLEHELVHSLLEAARKGQVAAAMFLLKCRHGYRETGQTDTAPKVAVQINLPGAMDERAYMHMVEAASQGSAADE
ncbi:hypothetical protein M527_13195 [Sphingobium indicum IP26]|uniref:Uncharacterized protein n=2 Tax=Sphingomonadaceae TaxID=41297 RepID=A0A8E0WVB2_9SPHN|nr:hypothetical protein M527_13195 [Sphingobium indicum IP26]EQB06833.1 hypothetical protein L286_05805 [Sphingobium sp. HDIP04]KER37543.1 hypothetical protein AL00_04825 [Sphingobium indicum F2]